MKKHNLLIEKLIQIDGNVFEHWQLLKNELNVNDAKLVYLPNVTQKQLSLFQKELTKKLIEDTNNAKALIRYILSHHIHVQSAIGTSEPTELFSLLESIPQRERLSVLNNLKEITLFINPALL